VEIVSYEEAVKSGLNTFFRGIPCVRGHLAPQYVSDRSCSVCKKMHSKIRHSSDKDNLLKEWKETGRKPKPVNPIKLMVARAKNRAKYKGIVFDLSYQFINNLKIPKLCPSCGNEIIFGKDNKFNSPSIDRIINNSGYLEDNVTIVCFQCNRDKSDKPTKWFKFWYELMLETEKKLDKDTNSINTIDYVI
jgi:hypothetical protein